MVGFKRLTEYFVFYSLILCLIALAPLILLVALTIASLSGVKSLLEKEHGNLRLQSEQALSVADSFIRVGGNVRAGCIALGSLTKVGFWKSIAISLGFASKPFWILLIPYFTTLILAGWVLRLSITLLNFRKRKKLG